MINCRVLVVIAALCMPVSVWAQVATYRCELKGLAKLFVESDGPAYHRKLVTGAILDVTQEGRPIVGMSRSLTVRRAM